MSAIYDYSNCSEENKDVINYCKGLKVGDKIKFTSEKKPYTLKAKSDRFLICTKPFNLKHTCLYTIIDLDYFIRGTNNRVFNNYDYMIQEHIDICLEDLKLNKIEVSSRNYIKLDVEIK